MPSMLIETNGTQQEIGKKKRCNVSAEMLPLALFWK
jgi:hypothetical protein